MKIKAMVPQLGLSLLMVLISTLFVQTLPAMSAEFHRERLKVRQAIVANGGDPNQAKLALVYHTHDRETLRKRVNLKDLKIDMANSFLQAFQVADPVITQSVVAEKKLNTRAPQQKQIKQVSTLLENSHLLLAYINPVVPGNQVKIDYSLYDRNGKALSRFQEIYPEQQNYAQSDVLEEYSDQDILNDSTTTESGNDSLLSNWSTSTRSGTFSQSWSHFVPNAYLNNKTNQVNISFWMKDLGSVELPVKNLRYDYRYKIAQVSLEHNRSIKDESHSSYLAAKALLASEDSLGVPVFVSAGLRYRIHWDSKNRDFKTSEQEETEEEKDLEKRDQLSLFLAVSGRVETLVDLEINTFIDNLRTGAGISAYLPYRLKAGVDAVLYRRKAGLSILDEQGKQRTSNYGDTDIGFTLSHYTTEYAAINLNYQKNTEQFSFGVLLDF